MFDVLNVVVDFVSCTVGRLCSMCSSCLNLVDVADAVDIEL